MHMEMPRVCQGNLWRTSCTSQGSRLSGMHAPNQAAQCCGQAVHAVVIPGAEAVPLAGDDAQQGNAALLTLNIAAIPIAVFCTAASVDCAL